MRLPNLEMMIAEAMGETLEEHIAFEHDQHFHSIARGFWQKMIWTDMLAGKEVDDYTHVTQNGRRFTANYAESLRKMIVRAELKGYQVEKFAYGRAYHQKLPGAEKRHYGPWYSLKPGTFEPENISHLDREKRIRERKKQGN